MASGRTSTIVGSPKSSADGQTRVAWKPFRTSCIERTFAENRNIADIEELVRLAEVAGLPSAEARDVLVERRAKESVDADWAKSRQYGITGVPTFVVGRRGLVGAQPYEALEQFVSTAGAA